MDQSFLTYTQSEWECYTPDEQASLKLLAKLTEHPISIHIEASVGEKRGADEDVFDAKTKHSAVDGNLK